MSDELNLDELFGDGEKAKVSEITDKTEILSKQDKPQKPTEELLNNEQKILILKRWEQSLEDPPSIEELCELAFPGQKFDGRTKQGREIKKYISSQNLPAPKTKTEYVKKEFLDLANEEKEFIKNNPNMRGSEIASALWGKPFYANNSQEVRTILNYQRELEKTTPYKKEVDGDELETFRPPKTFEHACARINSHIHGANYDSKKLSPTQKKQCLTLISYMHNPRFAHHMGLTNNADDRRLFQNTFIKYIYDKTDLSQEDLDQYLTLANEAVMESSIKRTISMLENEQTEKLQNDGKLDMRIIEALKTSRDEYNACIGRQQKLYKALEIERSKRLSERIGPQFTLLNIVEEMKNEERRKTLIAEAEKRNDKLKGEVKRLSELDDTIARIWGLDEDLIING